MAPPSRTGSKPGRALAVLAGLLIVMLIAIIGGTMASPAKWRHDFRVGLGLDLTSGTQATLQAIPPKGKKAPSSTDMKQAVAIMLARVNGSGNTGAQVQQMGNDLINVTVPGQGSQQVINEVSTTAQLRFRPVLLEAPSSAAPAPPASPSPSPSGKASPSPSGKASPSASAKATTKAAISRTGHAGGQQAVTDSYRVTAGATPAASATASPRASATPSPAASSSAKPGATPPAPSPAAGTAYGDSSQVSPGVLKLFNKLNCSNPNWKSQIGYTEQKWDDPSAQIVSCGTSGSTKGYKFALGKAVVLGTDVTSANAGIDTTSNQWVVNLTLNGKAAKAFSTLTSNQYSKYFSGASTNPNDQALDSTAIVLDGNVVSAPETQQAIPGGQVRISNIGGQQQATQLADELKYGALPLTFRLLNTTSVSPQLGRNQLDAGLIAAAIGLALVVLYSVFYYRGLALVSVFSLAISAALTFLSVVLLSKYQNFTLSLAGIAGLIVAIGITADSFVIFFERLRDEVREGRTLRTAVESGWKRARRTILVSDTVSFLAALLLYILAVGDVKGFAYTLGLTTIIDVVVVFSFTKPMVTLLAKTRFYGQGRRGSGLDPARLGARTPWRDSRGTAGREAARRGQPGAVRPARTTSREA